MPSRPRILRIDANQEERISSDENVRPWYSALVTILLHFLPVIYNPPLK